MQKLFFFKFLRTRYPRVPRGTTPRGKNPQNDFFLFKFFSQQILWVNTRRLTPRLSFYHKKWLRYGFLKFWGYPRGPKFETPVKPKIWVREQKSSGFLNNSPRGTFTPKKSKFYFLRVFSFTDLCWNHPSQKFDSLSILPGDAWGFAPPTESMITKFLFLRLNFKVLLMSSASFGAVLWSCCFFDMK